MTSQTFPQNPNLEYYKKQAKALVKAFQNEERFAIEQVRKYHPRFLSVSNAVNSNTLFTLADAQLVIAREMGFANWTQMKECIEEFRQRKKVQFSSQLLKQWSDTLNSRDLNTIHLLLSNTPLLGYQQFYPTEKLPHYHAAAYDPLLWAVMKEDFDIIRLLIESGLDPNYKEQSCLPLLIANREISDYLLNHGADINQYCENGGTALMWASCGDVERVKYLIKRGADVNTAKSNSGETPLMLAMGIDDEKTAVAIAKLLIGNGADVNARTFSGVEKSIPNHGNDENIDQGGLTALHLAAGNGKARVVQYLLEQGADPDSKTVSRRKEYFVDVFEYEPFDGETPLDWAVRNGRTNVIQILSHHDFNDLFWAACSGYVEKVRELIWKGADPNEINRERNKSVFNAAFAKGHKEICQILLDAGARPTIEVEESVRFGFVESVREALNENPSLKIRLLQSPYTLFTEQKATQEEHKAIVNLVHNTKPLMELDLIIAIWQKDIVLFMHIMNRFPKAAKTSLSVVPELLCFCADHVEMWEVLLKNGADVNAKNRFGAAPIHAAIIANSLKCLQLALCNGANPNGIMNNGLQKLPPLAWVIKQYHHTDFELLEPLLEAGADVNWVYDNGYTLLDFLHQRWGNKSENEYQRAVELMRKFGAKTAQELANGNG